MKNDIMIRIYFISGEVLDTTSDYETYLEFNKDAAKYLCAILSPIPRNQFKGYEVFEIEADKTIINKLTVFGDTSK